MKKYLAVFLVVALFGTLAFAEVSSLDVKEMSKEYSISISNLFENSVSNDISVKQYTSTKQYSTKQYIPFEMDEGYQESPTPEEKITNGSVAASITIPPGAKIQDYILTDTYGQLRFLNSKSIFLMINGKEVRFELDYTIKFTDKKYQKYFEENFYDIDLQSVSQPMTIIIRYSPRYFILKSYKNSYPKDSTSNIKYKGKNISLKTQTYHVLGVEKKNGETEYFVLKPNWQNIYNDFKFVREVK